MPKQVHVFEDGIAREPGRDQNVPRDQIKNPRVEVGWTKAHVDNPRGNVSLRLAADITWSRAAPGVPGEGGCEMDADIRAVIGDRNDINKLIRTLRKARDQAFGADA